MQVRPYIRQQPLRGEVAVIDWNALREHTEALDYIANQVDVYTRIQNPNRWLFAADLDLIAELLREIKETEARLMDKIRRSA